MIPSDIVALGLHAMIDGVSKTELVNQWRALKHTLSIECGYDGVLESKIDYRSYRREHHIVVSDLLSAGKTGPMANSMRTAAAKKKLFIR
jgi:hypothetical protein